MMTVFCAECGNKMSEKADFCGQCGAKLVKPTPTPAPAPTVEKPKKKQKEKPAAGSSISTGYFFGMMLVYMLPLVGWIICLVHTLKLKNPTKKHFAKAMGIWLIIGFIISIILAVLVTQWITMLIHSINQLAANGTLAIETMDSVKELLMLILQ